MLAFATRKDGWHVNCPAALRGRHRSEVQLPKGLNSELCDLSEMSCDLSFFNYS